jgi:hypothetical protein
MASPTRWGVELGVGYDEDVSGLLVMSGEKAAALIAPPPDFPVCSRITSMREGEGSGGGEAGGWCLVEPPCRWWWWWWTRCTVAPGGGPLRSPCLEDEASIRA